MKRFLTAGILALCLLSSQIARAQEDRDVKIKAEMVENYLIWQEAMKLTDAERIISFESREFTTTEFSGEITSKSDSNARLRSEMSAIRKVNAARVAIKKLTIEPNRVVVLSNKHYDVITEATNTDTNKPNGMFFKVKYTLTSRDIWVEYGGTWMLKRTEIVGFSGGATSVKNDFSD